MIASLVRVSWMQLVLSVCVYSRSKIRISIDTNEPIHILNPLSPSVAMGLTIFEYGWIDYFNDTKFLALARALAPIYLRVGGTKADVTHYEPDEVETNRRMSATRLSKRRFLQQCRPQERDPVRFETHRLYAQNQSLTFKLNKRKYGIRKVLKPITLTGAQWRKLNEFCQCVGWRLIFGLNLINRDGSAWNSTNAEMLLNYTENRYQVNWELGNEPNSYEHKFGVDLSPEQVGDGFVKLHTILEQSDWWRSSLVLGPDANRIGAKSAGTFLKRFLARAGNVISGLTFHQYYMNGRTANETQFLNPKTLNSIFKQIRQVEKVVQASTPGRPLWLGETASAYGGGAPGLSNSYLDGFTWLDKLGTTSRMGVSMVIRQSFINSNYDLLDDNFDPLPDYWLTLLYKRLVGNRVLNVSLERCSLSQCNSVRQGHVRIYAHCTKFGRASYKRGSVVLYFINLKPKPIRLTMLPFHNTTLRSDLYLLEPSIPGNLTSSEVRLNGNILRLTSTMSIPIIRPTRVRSSTISKGLKIPAHSYGFLVFSNAGVEACLSR